MDPSHDMLFDNIGDIAKLHDIEQEKPRPIDHDFVSREFARRLRDAQQKLEYTLEEYEEYRNPKRYQGSGLGTPLSVTELIAYAHKISYTTFAPPEYATGQFPLRGALPPAPQDEQMRASQLYFHVDMDIGLPKTSALAVSPGLPADTMEAIKLKPDEPPQTLKLPPGLQMPPGWRPGMPIELPAELPPIPPGWKPGDPIPLPPMPPGWKPGDSVVLPPTGAQLPQDQAATKPIPPPLAPSAPPPGVIQVPHIQLDLNSDLEDDYGSEYSDDDDGSSDDDDD